MAVAFKRYLTLVPHGHRDYGWTVPHFSQEFGTDLRLACDSVPNEREVERDGLSMLLCPVFSRTFSHTRKTRTRKGHKRKNQAQEDIKHRHK